MRTVLTANRNANASKGLYEELTAFCSKSCISVTLVLGDFACDDTISFGASLYVTKHGTDSMIIGTDILERFSCQVTSDYVHFELSEGRIIEVKYGE